MRVCTRANRFETLFRQAANTSDLVKKKTTAKNVQPVIKKRRNSGQTVEQRSNGSRLHPGDELQAQGAEKGRLRNIVHIKHYII